MLSLSLLDSRSGQFEELDKAFRIVYRPLAEFIMFIIDTVILGGTPGPAMVNATPFLTIDDDRAGIHQRLGDVGWCWSGDQIMMIGLVSAGLFLDQLFL